MKFFKRFIVVLGALLLLAALGVWLWLRHSRPVYDGSKELAGLSAPAEVVFDNYGIPHIYAQNETDLYRALGYVHAQERLFQMEILRRVGAGRMAEILGEKLLPLDRFLRTLGIEDWAKKTANFQYEGADPKIRTATLAYLDGINDYIDNGPTPPEFSIIGIPKRHFTLEDMGCIMGYMSYSFATGFKSDPLMSYIGNELGVDYLHDLDFSAHRGSQSTFKLLGTDSASLKSLANYVHDAMDVAPISWLEGSNAWAVSPARSASGKTLFCNDTHIAYSQPSVWFEAYLECPGFSYYGNHLAGIPFGLIGHNRFMSVGLTMFKNDDSDFYAETVNPKNSNQYSKKGVWTDFEIRKEVIKVKNAPDVNFDVRITNHGPIMNDVLPDLKQKQNAPLAVWWEHTQAPSRMFDAFYQISHSKSLAEVEQAASWIYSPGLNLLYADSTGNIAWWACARLPIRPKGPNPSLVLDGASGKDDILGYYSFDQNPSSVNPPEGILYSANNQADSTAKPIVEGYYADDYRARRIHELLLRKDKLTVADMLEIQMDDNGTQLKQTLADLVAVLNTKSLNDTEKKVLELAKTWDGTHSLMQQGPTIYTKWVYLVWQAAMADELGDKAAENLFNLYTGQRSLRYIFRLPNSPWWDNATTPARESLSDLVTQSFHETCKALAQQLGTDPTTWVWKRVHTVTYGHILGKKKPLDKLFDVGPFEATGGNEVVNKLDFVVTNSGEYPAKGGPAMRIICDFADITHSRSVLPTGQSGHFMSPYYADQATMYLAGKNRPQLMNRDDVEKGKHSILTLLPKK